MKLKLFEVAEISSLIKYIRSDTDLFFPGLVDGSTGDKSSSDPPKAGLILGCACQNRNNVEIDKI